jgi:hypothetical protein
VRAKNSDASVSVIYGVEDTPDTALPLANWFAAMNACDNVGGLFGGTMLGGAEILVDTEPLEALKAILKACNGRLTEAGGVYKLFIGNPGPAVVNITDGDILSDDETFEPILPLMQKINHITGTYTATNGWVPKVAPPRSNAASRTASGRRISADLDVPWVQSGNQCQRLMKAMLAEASRERRHVLPLSRAFFALEPSDVISWTSARNGYTAKLFRIDTCAKAADLSNIVAITELDPTDYDWVPADEITEDDIDVTPDAIPIKTITGLIASSIDVKGDTTTRAAIQLTWTDPQDLDIVGMEVQYSVTPNTSQPILTASSPDVSDLEMTVISGIQHQTTYDIRARFVSFEGFECAWSSWLTIAVGDVNVGGGITITTYLYDSNTTAADPGGGKLRLNAATWAATTKIYVDDLASAGPDYSAFFLKMVTNDTVRVQVGADATRFAKYTLTSAPIDHTGWFEFNVTPALIGPGAMPSNGNSLAVTWAYGAAAGSGGPPPPNSVGDAEIQNRSIKNIKAFSNREFTGQFFRDASYTVGPPKGAGAAGVTEYPLASGVDCDATTTVVWCIATLSGSVTIIKPNSSSGKIGFEIIARPSSGPDKSLAVGSAKFSQKSKQASWALTMIGSTALGNSTYQIILVATNHSVATGKGFKINMIGQAPRT